MNLVRILVIALAAWVIFRIWQNYRAGKPRDDQRRGEIPNMVACAVCHTHVPEHEALQKNGRFYCSQAHLEADR